MNVANFWHLEIAPQVEPGLEKSTFLTHWLISFDFSVSHMDIIHFEAVPSY